MKELHLREIMQLIVLIFSIGAMWGSLHSQISQLAQFTANGHRSVIRIEDYLKSKDPDYCSKAAANGEGCGQ